MLAVVRYILEIAYHLLSEQTTYQELGIDYFDYRAERFKRRSLAQLQRLGATKSLLCPFLPPLKEHFQDSDT